MEGNWRVRRPEPSSSQAYSSSSSSRSHRTNRSNNQFSNRRANPSHPNSRSHPAAATSFDLPSNYKSRQPSFNPDNVKGKTFTGKVLDRLRLGALASIIVKEAEEDAGVTLFVYIKYAEPAVGVEVDLLVLDVHRETIRAVLKPVDPIRAVETLPLLILDLNGVLLDRRSYHERRKGRGARSLQLRPYCVEFLRFCFRHFQVGVWSCGKRQNMELELFDGYTERLVFVWDQEASTNLWPQRSHVSEEKPLFLKELSNVFKAFPQFSADNTILVDNHLEKFQRNPANTCCLVPEFKHNDNKGHQRSQQADDNVLAPDGSLTAVLKSLHDQYPETSTSKCIASFDSAFFPKSYDMPVQQVGPGLFETVDGRTGTDLRREVARLFTSSAYMKRHCPDRDEQFYMRHRDIPGPRAMPLRRKHLVHLHNPNEPHVVCEKSDGIRMLLFVPPRREGIKRDCYLVNRSWTFIYGGNIDAEVHCLSFLKDQDGATLLDGEMLEGSTGKRLFLVFDVVWLDSVDFGLKPSLLDRMQALTNVFAQTEAEEDMDFAVTLKEFLPMRDVSRLKSNVYAKSYPSVGKVACDGLVITPVNLSYYEYTVYKFKPPELLTVDFQVEGNHWRNAKSDQVVKLSATSYTNRSGKPLTVTFAQCQLSRDEIRAISRKTSGRQSTILECSFDRTLGVWKMKGVRPDKRSPNSLDTAWQVMESIAEGLELSDLDSSNLSVAQHYNQRQDDRNQGKTPEDGIFMLRKLNNLAKSLLFLEQVYGQPTDSQHDSVSTNNAPLPSLFADTKAPLQGTRRRLGKPTQRLAVLDLACGRGGDLLKWNQRDGLESYFGVDIADVALVEARRRARQMRGKAQFYFHQIDMASAKLGDAIQAATPSLLGAFDIVSIQFAFHYCCGEQETCRQLLKNVATQLKTGGKVCISTIDSRVLASVLADPEKSVYSNDVCRVELEKSGNAKMDFEKDFGIGYTITVGDAVQECMEYVVPIPRVIEMAREEGLEVVKVQNFGTFLTHHIESDFIGARSLMKRMKLYPLVRPVSQSEWQTIQLYCVLAFEKAST